MLRQDSPQSLIFVCVCSIMDVIVLIRRMMVIRRTLSVSRAAQKSQLRRGVRSRTEEIQLTPKWDMSLLSENKTGLRYRAVRSAISR